METNFNFKSQICTDRFQSERLLALGLKKETADMCSVIDHVSDGGKWEEVDTIFSFTPDDWNFRESVTPRWSLHRLIEMMPSKVEFPLSGMPKDFYFEIHNDLVRYYNGYVCCVMEGGGYYKGIIDCIEWLIKAEYFNKEYLEE